MAHTFAENVACPECGDLDGCHLWPNVRRAVEAFGEVAVEIARAMQLHRPLNSDHEAYAVILEELDEYWEEVKKKRALRNRTAMRKELAQIAAMAIRAIADLHRDEAGN